MTKAEKTARGLRGPQRLLLWGSAAAMLLAPAVAMKLTTEMAWGPEDFATLALMLIIAGGAFELAAWRTLRPIHLALIGAAIGLVFLLIWAQLAVGIW